MKRLLAILFAVTILFVACDKDTVHVTGVSLNKSTLSLTEGASETLTAAVTPADADNRKVTWKSDKPDIATVDAEGKVTAVKAGTAIITVTAEDGLKTAACTVTVTAVEEPLEVDEGAGTEYDIPEMTAGVKIADIDISKAVTGGKPPYAYAATGLPEGIVIGPATGIISGTPAGEPESGTATITITDSSEPAKSVTITIDFGATDSPAPAFVPVTDITGVPAGATAGTSLTLTGAVAPANATNKTITWSIKDAGTTGATVSGSTFNATGAGAATVTATIVNGATESTNYTKDFTITVTSPPVLPTFVPVTDIADLPAAAVVGAPLALTGTVAPTHATNKTITWSIKDAGTTGATISGVTFSVTGAGTATVTATIVNGATESTPYTQDFDITVTAPGGDMKITPAAITGITSPVTGAAPDMTVEETDQYTAVIQWWYVNGAHTGPFTAGTEYLVFITLTAKEGYTFEGLTDDDMKGFTVNGIVPYGAARLSETKGFVQVRFPETEGDYDVPGQITPAPIMGVTNPVTGAEPDMTVEETDQYTAVTQWWNGRNYETDSFAAGTAYWATITLTAKGDYTFDGLTSNDLKGFTVNGIEPYNATRSSETEIIVHVLSPKTEGEADALTQITPAPIMGIDNPVAGVMPQTAIETDQYTATIDWWNGGTPASFVAGRVYWADIYLTAKEGYTFDGLTLDDLQGFTVNDIEPYGTAPGYFTVRVLMQFPRT
ncbi:MAG: Ig-like domain-containing protein [Bacteroidales bacterium]|jgi:uncharacterized protein YjdB|nr:Ig-like domain-containing protein [Bacteroidales bacterium]